MKDNKYDGHDGRDGSLKMKKKEKRKFEVIMKTGNHIIYSDYTPIKTAKKVTIEIASKNKKIFFHLREKGKSGKIYGPYIGYIKDGKAIVKINKISGGGADDYDWTNHQLKVFFKNNCFYNYPKYAATNNQFNFMFEYKEPNLGTSFNMVIFGTDLIFIATNNYYLPYVYYLFKDTIKFKKISEKDNDISFEDISFDELLKIMVKNGSHSESIINLLNNALNKNFKKTPAQQQLANKLAIKLEKSNSMTINPNFNITKKNNSERPEENYRCEDPSKEVNIVKNRLNSEDIYFGYDNDLIINKKDIFISNSPIQKVSNSSNSFKFYYKYKYSSNTQSFLILKKKYWNDYGKYSFYTEEIDISLIPIYDILSLYNTNFGDNVILREKLRKRINDAIKNISKTGEAFIRLDLSNFNKEKKPEIRMNMSNNEKIITNKTYKNFGKVKKRRVTNKTYIFFGSQTSKNNIRNIESRFLYACFREDNKVFYYSRIDLNKKSPLSELGNIDALKDLISFILLRRMSSNKDKDFADIILQEAKATLNFWKVQRISEKMITSKFPKEYDYTYSVNLTPTLKKLPEPIRENRQKLNLNEAKRLLEISNTITQISILPTSSEPIKV